MLKVEFNSGPTREALNKARAALDDLTPLHRQIGEYLLGSTQDRLSYGAPTSGVAPNGTRWAPKAQSTIEHYERRGYGGMSKTRTLYLSGQLSKLIVKYADRNGVIIGSNLPYAAVMQEGAAKGAFGHDKHGRPLPWGNIPARRWLGLSAKDEAEIAAMAESYVAGILED